MSASITFHGYTGCGDCPLQHNGLCAESKVSVQVRFKGPEYADDWGRQVQVFSKGETVNAEIHIRDNVVYCVGVVTDDYSDYVNENNVEIIFPETSQARISADIDS